MCAMPPLPAAIWSCCRRCGAAHMTMRRSQTMLSRRAARRGSCCATLRENAASGSSRALFRSVTGMRSTTPAMSLTRTGCSRQSTARCTCLTSTWRAVSGFSNPTHSRPDSIIRSLTRRSARSASLSALMCALQSCFASLPSKARG